MKVDGNCGGGVSRNSYHNTLFHIISFFRWQSLSRIKLSLLRFTFKGSSRGCGCVCVYLGGGGHGLCVCATLSSDLIEFVNFIKSIKGVTPIAVLRFLITFITVCGWVDVHY